MIFFKRIVYFFIFIFYFAVDKNVREGNSLCVYKVVAKLLGKSVQSMSNDNDDKAEMTIKLNVTFPLSVVSENDDCKSLSKVRLLFLCVWKINLHVHLFIIIFLLCFLFTERTLFWRSRPSWVTSDGKCSSNSSRVPGLFTRTLWKVQSELQRIQFWRYVQCTFIQKLLLCVYVFF